tara:strand:- start:462 stop:716 length:255 start_codon:yes stop_codon:yes gene_type:complete
MICSNCYTSQITPMHDVGHWWNNPPDHVFVCSDKCYTELEKLAKDRTWMEHKPVAIFGKKKEKVEKKKMKPIGAVTDRQFTSNL